MHKLWFVRSPAWAAALLWAASLSLPARGQAAAPPSVPAAMRLAYVQSVQNDAGPAFAVRPRAGARSRAHNPEQGLDIILESTQIRLRRIGGSDGAAMALTQYGCAGSLRPARQTPPVRTAANRVEYRRDGVTEWYVNGPLGLEQGFTVDHDMGCQRDGIEFRLAVRGPGELTQVGSAVELRDPASGRALRYGGLLAVDAQGKELPSRLQLDHSSIRLHVSTKGARYPVIVDPMWSQKSNFTATDGATDDNFGNAMALSGDTAIIGAYKKVESGHTAQGVAYIFVRSGSTWTQQAKLSPPDGAAFDQFGTAVAIDKDTALVGALYKTVTSTNQGQVYVYVRSGTSWSLQAKLTAADAAVRDYYGAAVAIDGSTALVGAWNKTVSGHTGQGQVYVYSRSGTTWAEEARLTPSGAANGYNVGIAVGLSGSLAVIGASGALNAKGTVYFFSRTGTTWRQDSQVYASDGADSAFFGQTVAIGGTTAVIGSPLLSSFAGAAYVFTRSGTTWTEQGKLLASDSAPGDNFGWAAAIAADGTRAVIGARSAKSGQGQAYVFTRAGTSWSEDTILAASDGIASEAFGASVALGDGFALAGVPNKSIVDPYQGGVYMFTPGVLAQGQRCTRSETCISGNCVDGVCCDSSCDDGCGACSVAAGAVKDGTCSAAKAGKICRAATDACDQAETCDGKSLGCAADALKPAMTECRAAAGLCDTPGRCSGASVQCPPNFPRPKGFECRAAASVCDLAETCNGVELTCPKDNQVADGMGCAGGSCFAGMCRVGADLAVPALLPANITFNGKEPLTFQILVVNNSRVAASGVRLALTLPAGASLQGGAELPWSCVSTENGVECGLATLEPGTAPLLNVTVAPPGDVPMFTVTATVAANEPDPDASNNTATATATRLAAGSGGCDYGRARPRSVPPALAMLSLLAGLGLLRSARRRRQ